MLTIWLKKKKKQEKKEDLGQNLGAHQRITKQKDFKSLEL